MFSSQSSGGYISEHLISVHLGPNKYLVDKIDVKLISRFSTKTPSGVNNWMGKIYKYVDSVLRYRDNWPHSPGK